MAASAADKSKPYIPLNSGVDDGYSKDNEATATCYCGAVQLLFVSVISLHNDRLGTSTPCIFSRQHFTHPQILT